MTGSAPARSRLANPRPEPGLCFTALPVRAKGRVDGNVAGRAGRILAHGLTVYFVPQPAAARFASRSRFAFGPARPRAIDLPHLRSFALGRKLYVGNLSYGVSSSDLETLFAAFGSVQSAEVITDRDTGRSKGFGFVEMGSDEAAQAAIQGLNGKENDGRALTVNEAKPREERGGGRGPRGGGGGGGGYGGGRGGRY